jgi:hypothetical protein
LFWRAKSYRPEGPCALACTALGYATLNLRKELYVTDTSDLAWSGYGMDDGELWLGHAGHDYLNIEYATDRLEPQDQWADVISAFLKGRLRFDEAHGLLRYLESRNDCKSLCEEYESTYPKEFYPDHPWRTISRD